MCQFVIIFFILDGLFFSLSLKYKPGRHKVPFGVTNIFEGASGVVDKGVDTNAGLIDQSSQYVV